MSKDMCTDVVNGPQILCIGLYPVGRKCVGDYVRLRDANSACVPPNKCRRYMAINLNKMNFFYQKFC